MKFHIVRNNETLEDVLFLYNLTKDELIEQNKHIRVWNKIIPGTKLKIPPITEAVELELSDMEPFVEDYYPKLNHKEFESIPEEEIPLETGAVSEMPDNPTCDESVCEHKEPEGKQEKQEVKPGYPPELLNKKKGKKATQYLPYVINYKYPYGYYGYHPGIPYRVVYYPVHQSKKPT